MASDQHTAAFRQWLADELRLAPTSPQALLAWWPVLKHKLRLAAQNTNRQWRMACPPLDNTALVQAATAAVAQLGAAASQHQIDAAMQAVMTARAALRAHQQRHCAAS